MDTSYDFNGDLGARPFAEVRPQWMEKPVLNEWARYAGDVLSMGHWVLIFRKVLICDRWRC